MGSMLAERPEHAKSEPLEPWCARRRAGPLGVLEFREVWQGSGGEKDVLAVWPGEGAAVILKAMSSS